MAIIVNAQPATDVIHSAYRPLIFELAAGGVTVVDVRQVTAEIEINGDIVAQLRSNVVRKRVPPLFPVIPVYYIDVSRIVQDFLTENFNDLGTGGGFVDAESFALVRINAFEWVENASGLVEKNPVGITSNYIGVVNATLQHEEQQDMVRFMGNDTINPDIQQKLTVAPEWQEICLNQNAFIPFYGDTILAYRVRTFDAGGTLIEEGVKNMPTITTTAGYGKDNVRRSIGVGTAQIINTPAWDLGGVTTLDNVSYYTVDFGIITTFGGSPGFGLYTDVVPANYDVKRNCCEIVRVHFMNRYGGIDQFNLERSEKGNELKTKTSNQFERKLEQGFAKQDRGVNNLNIESQFIYQLGKNNLKEFEWDWLQDLLDSPQVQVEQDGEYLPVYVTGRTNKQKEDDFYFIEIELKKSNFRIRQRN